MGNWLAWNIVFSEIIYTFLVFHEFQRSRGFEVKKKDSEILVRKDLKERNSLNP